MKRTLPLLVAVCLAAAVLGGCGALVKRLPRVKLEPPPAQSAAAPEQPAASTAAAPSGETAAAPDKAPPPVIRGTLPKPAGGSGAGGAPRYVPVGSQQKLTSDDLQGLSKWQLDVLRNEIYAAHGRVFDRSDLQAYFDRQTWYVPDRSFTESRLSSLEKRNAAFIASYQRGRGQGGVSRTTVRRSAGSGGQILPFSSDRSVTASDLSGLSKRQRDLARNEIYARHGRPFKRAELRSYFRSQGWYSEDASFTESRLSSLEKRNAEFIRGYR